MRKIISILFVSILVFCGSSFKAGVPATAPMPLPNYTIVDITNIDDFIEAYSLGSIYAIKVRMIGSYYYDNTTGHQCDCIVNDPDDTSIWNGDTKFWYSADNDFQILVWIKYTSESSWQFFGSAAAAYGGFATEYVDNNWIWKLSISISNLNAA